ncbi:class I SAM-dependent methyltransferase [Paenibacillus validus]|uniref:Methyltransferase domain-containing protein n=1 Tax=Paenibacillus validus TaxID=44253 RepID=A0A7X3CTX9_9BACL|nr:class I SAM-dependent methyltransferase [Paenibacillus validus]MUG73315.1 methyltransferase domain-containing protein [Paenibacillus validus]
MASDQNEETSKSWETAEQVAAWNRSRADRERLLGEATELMLRESGVREGTQLLDVAAGTGDQTFKAARMIGPAGNVVATDISATMLQVLAEIAKQESLTNIQTHVMDAQHVDLPIDTFDAAISRHGLMFVPELEQALTGIREVLKTGGKFAALVWSSPDNNPTLSLPMTIISRYAGIPIMEGGKKPGVFSLGNPNLLAEAFQTVGFRDVTVQAIPHVHRYASAVEFSRRGREDVSAGPLGEIIKRLSEEERKQMHMEIIRALQTFEGPAGFEGPSESLLVVGIK